MATDINTIRDFVAAVRGRRRLLGLTQAELARRARVSRQWVSEFESGKPTAELGLVLRMLDALELRLSVADADSADVRSPQAIDLDAILDDHRQP